MRNFIHANQKSVGFPDPTSIKLIQKDVQHNVDISYIRFYTNRAMENMEITLHTYVNYNFQYAGCHVTQNYPIDCLGHLMYQILPISD
jgi:hypothetical protein